MPFVPFLPDIGSLFWLLVVLALAAFWVVEFIELMSLSDERFPGQHVRLGWIAAFIVLWALAPIAFMAWNRSSQARNSTVSRLHRGRREEAD